MSEHEQTMKWFKDNSLRIFEEQITIHSYPNYPTQRLYLPLTESSNEPCPWEMNPNETPTPKDTARFIQQGYAVEATGRPLHPWFESMVTNPNIGVVTGRGFYWNWGPNKTADPIIVRYDKAIPHILLITRKDTGALALPGGFIDEGEIPLMAACREASEEALIDLSGYPSTPVYEGPIADLRTTANAWPHTFAYRFDIPVTESRSLSLDSYKAGDDALEAHWLAADEVTDRLFGSHRLLIELALRSVVLPDQP